MPPSLVNIFEQVAGLLTNSLGFSKQGAERQLSEIEKIIMAAIIKKMAEEKKVPLSELGSEKKLTTFFQSFTDEKKLKKIIEHESTRVLNEYFTTVTAGLASRDRTHFYSALQSIVSAV